MEKSKKRIKLAFLGSGSGITRRGRFPSGVIIDDRIMVDAPPQAMVHLKKMNVNTDEIEEIFITHFHPDHVLGLVMMLQEWLTTKSRKKPVKIYGPIGMTEFLTSLFDSFYLELNNDYSSLCLFTELPARESHHNMGDFEFYTVPLEHTPRCIGYRIKYQGRTIAVSGDTGMCDNVRKLFDADAVVLEMTFVLESHQGHLNMKEHLPKVVGMMKEDARLFLYHFTETNDDIYYKLLTSGDDKDKKLLEILQREDVELTDDLKVYMV